MIRMMQTQSTLLPFEMCLYFENLVPGVKFKLMSIKMIYYVACLLSESAICWLFPAIGRWSQFNVKDRTDALRWWSTNSE